MSSNQVSRARAEFIVTYFLAFEAMDVRYSFMVGNRNYFGGETASDYRKKIFRLILNMFTTDITDKQLQQAACGFFRDFLDKYGELLIRLNADGRPKAIETTSSLKTYKGSMSDDYAQIRTFWEILAECDGTSHYFDYSDLNLSNDVSGIFPDSIPDMLETLNSAYHDLIFAERRYNELREKSSRSLSCIATPNQLMSGAKEFMAHIGVAVCFALLDDECRDRIKQRINEESIFLEEQSEDMASIDELIRRNIRSSERHLDFLIIDFMKAAILYHMENYRLKKRQELPWPLMKKVINTRHCESRGLGRGFSYRFTYYLHLLADVVNLLDIPKNQINLLKNN